MIRKACFFASITVLLLFSSSPASADALGFAKNILSLADLKCDFGWGVDTYEDVKTVTGIEPKVSGLEMVLTPDEFENSSKMLKEADGKKLLDLINKNGGAVINEEKFLAFLYKHFYLDSGSRDKEQVWHKEEERKFPFDYDGKRTRKPHTKRYFLCLDEKPTWHYTGPPGDIKPDAKSCDVNRDFCGYGEKDNGNPCERWEEKTDLNGNGNTDDPGEKVKQERHNQTEPNVYTNLHKYLKKEEGVGVKENQSDVEFKLIFKDRTPPIIEGCKDGKFPELGSDKPATTGDWYKVEGLKISDNSSKFVGTCLALGKIDRIPALTWTAEENWVFEPPRALTSGEDTDYVIMPNACHGVMRYSVFAWDKSGNINPGEPNIRDDEPCICYGLSDPPDGITDLGDVPNSALPWPIVASWPESIKDIDKTNIDKIDLSKVNPGDRRGEGNVHIRDNDAPNLVIRIESLKDKSRIFFPPVMPPSALPIFNSTEFEKYKADPEGNAKAYRDFIGVTPEAKYDTTKLANLDLKLPIYFRVIAALPRKTLAFSDAGMAPADVARLSLFKDTTKLDFTKTHVRLEDYNQSDTTGDGSPETAEATMGARNGFGGEITALLTTPLQEDVEYQISIWVDDNVKWATIDESGKVLEKIIAVPTGVIAGEIRVEAANQYPAASYQARLDKEKAVSEPLTVVFREPTQPVKGELNEETMSRLKFPYIMATATDYAGITRKIKLYVEVSNENPEIRVLERTHEKNKD
ncbi:MAG TPA: hypothetical protein PLM07_06270 [Candidatus Rifleibacterium sp.]|nr:hypothetical protein [Candidatus Rifleibacterium sp.]HPT45486.1 hypothetical protein [Candidatus Rifleibacterium sp.]